MRNREGVLKPECGVIPVGERILILVDEIPEQTKGGIYFTDDQISKEKMSQTVGTLVAVGDQAWSDYAKPWAKVGDRVIFAKYQGMMHDGKDGKAYRLLNDKDLVAVIEE
jgi:co-chaperonin GroES (HSP10)